MQGEKLIQQYARNWQLKRVLEAVLYALGVALLIGFITRSIGLGVILFVVVTALGLFILKPWKITLNKVAHFIDHTLQTAEYSTSLVMLSSNNLSGIAQLQQHRVEQQLATDLKRIPPKTGLKRAFLFAILMTTLGYGLSKVYDAAAGGILPNNEIELITFQTTDSTKIPYKSPVLLGQRLTIQYPDYTKVPDRTSSQMNAKIVDGSRLIWKLEFDTKISSVHVEGFGPPKTMKLLNGKGDGNTPHAGRAGGFAKAITPTSSGYYNFRFIDTLGASYASDMYAVEIVPDTPPVVELRELAQFTSFEYNDSKTLSFTAQISDDFGIAGAEIVATVSKGSGESVKFREEKLAFDQTVRVGEKTLRLSKTIRLDALKMELGDELYFYVTARDQRTPRANVTRSETYFAVIKDTVSDGFGVEGTMGADLMPDYFRSQRQLIIDTEKLIKEQPQLNEKEFKSRSNELGYDQKALRLKYGKFMGDEADSGIAVSPDIPESAFDEDDPTAGYRHDHDGENEHNLVEVDGHDHEDEQDGDHEEGEEKSLLEDYLHNHDDPEESTLFTESLRGKLKQAMAEMWDAELYLRLATPQESLPYQYKALKLIQEIKNSARIYVHRIGFDPPPIKEDKRLSGDLEEVDDFYKNETIAVIDAYQSMRESVQILEKRIMEHGVVRDADREVFTKAGQELASIAINEPAKHLTTLQQLKWLAEDKKQPVKVFKDVQRGLLRALPPLTLESVPKETCGSDLERVFIQELNSSD